MKKRFYSIFLVICIVFLTIGNILPVYATESISVSITQTPEKETISEDTVITSVLAEDDCPQVIDLQEARSKGHIRRMREKETSDNTVIFLNNDGTETIYFFAQDVKYTDSDGTVKDKSTALTASGNDFVMADNDVNVRFSSLDSDGVSVSKDDVLISMIPNSINNAVSRASSSSLSTATASITQDNKAIYTNAFGNGAHLAYTPLLSGVKEDIILESFTGQTEFSFIISTNGLYPVKQTNGSCLFFDPATDEAKAKMLQVMCFDADNKFAGGDIVITELVQNQKYIFTIIPDIEFLTSESTVYPVAVDPTITLDLVAEIEDTVIYSGKPTHNYADYKYLNVGYVDSTYKIGRMLVKFPTLQSNSAFSNINSENISTATFSLYTASGGSTSASISVHPFKQGYHSTIVTWYDITTTMGNADSTVTMPSGGAQKVTFDVTDTVKYWADIVEGDSSTQVYTPTKGICLKNTNESSSAYCRDFLSVEYATSKNVNYMPCLEIRSPVREIYVSNEVVTMDVGETYYFLPILLLDGEQTLDHNGAFVVTPSNSVISMKTTFSVTAESNGKSILKIEYVENGIVLAETEIIFYVGSYIDFENTEEPVINLDSSQPRIDINAFCVLYGEIYETDTNIVYGIKNNYTGYTANIDEESGLLTLTVTNDGLKHNEGSYLIITATHESLDISNTITVSTVCSGNYPTANGNPLSGIQTTDCRYIRIDYNNQDGYDNLTSLQRMAASRNMSCYDEIICANFSKPEGLFWHEARINVNGTNYTQSFLEIIRNTKVACILTHGQPGGISLNNSTLEELLTINDINELHDGYFNYCDLIILASCCGGTVQEGDNINSMSFLEVLSAKGAGAVVGYNSAVNTPAAQQFEYDFLNSLRSDATYFWLNSRSCEVGTDCQACSACNERKKETKNRTIQEAFVYARENTWSIAGPSARIVGEETNKYLN